VFVNAPAALSRAVLCAVQCGILPYAGVDICLFELLKDRLLDRYDGDPPHAAIVGGGMVSSSIAQFVSYPLALVRTRLQVRQAADLGAQGCRVVGSEGAGLRVSI
jgi:solute carrier family 25 phosphate transporter 23/24/25/41